MTTRHELLININIFLVRHWISRSRFGKLAHAGEAFVYRLEEGKDVKASTIERLETWMDECDKRGMLFDSKTGAPYKRSVDAFTQPTERKRRNSRYAE